MDPQESRRKMKLASEVRCPREEHGVEYASEGMGRRGYEIGHKVTVVVLVGEGGEGEAREGG